MQQLLLATDEGVAVAQRQGDGWQVGGRFLAGHSVTSLAVQGSVILAGTRRGVIRSVDGGQTWQEAGPGLATWHVRWLAAGGAAGLFLAGTEPAAIFVSHDRGVSWRECPEVGRLRSEHRWFLPYSPEAGCIRGFALADGRGYAAAEVGGALRSDDGGETWRMAEGSSGNPGFYGPPAPFVHPDVHSILVHPSSADRVIAPTGGGLYSSADGGKTWACLYECYCRAAWADPADASHLIFGPADSVSQNGRIEESHDSGRTWRPASAGLSVPWRRHMVERFVEGDDQLVAVLSNGELVATMLPGLSWHTICHEVTGVSAVAFFGRQS